MDTMMRFDNNNLVSNFMSIEDAKSKVPFIGMDAPTNPSLSKHYRVATTETIAHDLETLGWGIVDAKAQATRALRNHTERIQSFHMMAFQNPNVKILDKDNNVEAFPRIILTNSHDGRHKFKFMVGLFRLVCSNGLVVASEKFSDLNVRHMGYDFSQLQELVGTVLDGVTEQTEQITLFKGLTMNNNQRKKFVIDALNIKIDNDKHIIHDLTDDEYEEILTPIRDEDEHESLWDTFNIVQEKLTKKGMYSLRTDKDKMRVQRGIIGLAKNIDFNHRLWALAKETAEEINTPKIIIPTTPLRDAKGRFIKRTI